MKTAKLFRNGKSQAVRLPKEFSFRGKEVYVKRVGRDLILMPKENPWESWISNLESFTPDFMSERVQPKTEDREGL